MIIFEGDWVKVGNKWRQVVDIIPSDRMPIDRSRLVLSVRETSGELQQVWDDSIAINGLLSDHEMQERING